MKPKQILWESKNVSVIMSSNHKTNKRKINKRIFIHIHFIHHRETFVFSSSFNCFDFESSQKKKWVSKLNACDMEIYIIWFVSSSIVHRMDVVRFSCIQNQFVSPIKWKSLTRGIYRLFSLWCSNIPFERLRLFSKLFSTVEFSFSGKPVNSHSKKAYRARKLNTIHTCVRYVVKIEWKSKQEWWSLQVSVWFEDSQSF